MGIAALVCYDMYFSDSGNPKTGLSPVTHLNSHTTGAPIASQVAEVGNGWYMLYTSGTSIGNDTYVGYADGGSGLASNVDRYIPVRITPYDYAVDAYVSDVPTAVDVQLTATHGAGAWGGSSGGSGANAVSVYVVDANTAPIAGAMVNIYNGAETTLIAYGTTDANGRGAFLLDNGAYSVRLARYSTFTFANPFNLVISGPTTTTYTGVPIVGPLPPIPETCVVSGRCLDGDGNPITSVFVSATVIGSLITYKDLSDNVTSVASQQINTKSDTNGVWYLTLISSAYLYSGGSPGTMYRFKLKGKGMDETKDATIPSTGSAKYEEI